MGPIQTAHYLTEVLATHDPTWHLEGADQALTDLCRLRVITKELDRWLTIPNRVDSQLESQREDEIQSQSVSKPKKIKEPRDKRSGGWIL